MYETSLNFPHRFIAAPGRSRSHTLLLLHGTGGSELDLLPVGRQIASGAALLSPRGKVLENGKSRFFRRFAEGIFDLEDVHHRADELADFVAAAATIYGFDQSSVVGVGYSNGANMAAALLLLRPETLAGAILFRALAPLTPRRLPDLQHKSVLLSAGARDTIILLHQTEELAMLLNQAGAEVSLRWQDAGHNLAAGEIREAADWLEARWGALAARE
jgi:predicted esterase